jgi:hypothetical protein
MIIRVDKEGHDILLQLCDIALRNHGIDNLKQINVILSKVEVLSEIKEVPKENEKS